MNFHFAHRSSTATQSVSAKRLFGRLRSPLRATFMCSCVPGAATNPDRHHVAIDTQGEDVLDHAEDQPSPITFSLRKRCASARRNGSRSAGCMAAHVEQSGLFILQAARARLADEDHCSAIRGKEGLAALIVAAVAYLAFLPIRDQEYIMAAAAPKCPSENFWNQWNQL